MKITNKEAIGIVNVLAGMGNKALPLKLSYAVSKNRERLVEDICKPYNEALKPIEEKYALRDSNGEPKKNKDGETLLNNSPEFRAETGELLEIENEITFHTVPEDVLERCEDDRYSPLTPNEYEVLSKYFIAREES